MSTSLPTPLPAPTASASPDASAAADVQLDTQTLATTTTAPATSAWKSILLRLAGLVSSPVNAAVLFAVITFIALRYFSERLTVQQLKLAAAGCFAAVVYGLAAYRDQDIMLASKGFGIISNATVASSNLSFVKRLMASWYIVFPAAALGAAMVRPLTPLTMVLAADALILAPSVLQSQRVLS